MLKTTTTMLVIKKTTLFISIFTLFTPVLFGQILLDSIKFGNTPYMAKISKDGSKVFVAGKDSTGTMWDINGNKLLTLKGHSSSVSSIDYNDEKKTILTGAYDNIAILWDMNGNIISKFVGHTKGVINITQSGNLIGTAGRDKTAKVWDRKGKLKFTLEGHVHQVNTIEFVPEKKWIFTSSWDGSVRIWDYKGKPLQTLFSHESGVRTAAISLNKQIILAGHRDGKISIYDLNGNLKKIIDGHDHVISGIKFIENDEYFISSSADKSIKIWKPSGELVTTILGHNAWVGQPSFAKGMLVTSGDAPENMVRIWDITPTIKKNEPFTCANNGYLYLKQSLGNWNVKTKDRTSPDVYEDNTGSATITPTIEGCGISIRFRGSYRGNPYAREVALVALDSVSVQMVALDSEHGSYSVLNGLIQNDKLELIWYRNHEKKRLQSKYIMTFQNKNQFEFSSFLSTDYGSNWALTHERKYRRKE